MDIDQELRDIIDSSLIANEYTSPDLDIELLVEKLKQFLDENFINNK